eukprot:4411577-Heterocapsa_arctica.AAC.1
MARSLVHGSPVDIPVLRVEEWGRGGGVPGGRNRQAWTRSNTSSDSTGSRPRTGRVSSETGHASSEKSVSPAGPAAPTRLSSMWWIPR